MLPLIFVKVTLSLQSIKLWRITNTYLCNLDLIFLFDINSLFSEIHPS